MLQSEDLPGAAKAREAFFGGADWLSSSVSVACTLSVYLVTLAPDVTLEWSGILSTGAMHGGGQPPPGYPLWTLYAWAFIKLLPFSNIAWRVAVSSAVAGALTCGVIALMVSRGASALLDGAMRRLSVQQEKWLRVVCGCVAGMGFGFDSAFWHQAVIVETTTFGILLFSTLLYLLWRWVHAPEQTGYLCAAFFVYGLTLTVNLSMTVAAPGLPFIVLFRKPPLGRDLFFGITLALAALLLAQSLDLLPEGMNSGTQLRRVYLLIEVVTAAIALVAIVATRGFLTHWPTLIICGIVLMLGLSLYVYIPIASMTSPPVNWAYPRSASGFIHLISRGQFEQIAPTAHFSQFVSQLQQYAKCTVHALGIVYIPLALIPFCFLSKLRASERAWLLGLLPTFLCLSLLLLAMINPTSDRSAWQVLAVWAGYGLALLSNAAAPHRLP